MPKYHDNEIKFEARQRNVDIFRKLTGLYSIPIGRQYWTLCNEQPKGPGSEIVQLIDLGLLTVDQFHGVDKDVNKHGKESGIIRRNRKWHPNAHWYRGDWIATIKEQTMQGKFKPAMIYLDTTSFADYHIASNMVGATMMRCPSGTVLFANVMLNDSHSSKRFDEEALVRNLGEQIPSFELDEWDTDVQTFSYNASGFTNMLTHAFFKRGKS